MCGAWDIVGTGGSELVLPRIVRRDNTIHNTKLFLPASSNIDLIPVGIKADNLEKELKTCTNLYYYKL